MRAALAAALALRRSLIPPLERSCLRLVDGVGDGLPGLVVEKWGSVLRVESYDAHWRAARREVAEAVAAEWPGIEAAAGAHRPLGGEDAETTVLFGEVPAGVVVVEAGLRYLVRLASGAVGLGLFLDQRGGRRVIWSAAHGGPSLNLFAHAGGFGVAAAAGGASRVDQVDAARKCAMWSSVNLALNGHDPRAHRFLVDDAFKVLERAAKKGPAYQTVVCDPPTTARRPTSSRRRGAERFVAKDELAALATSCVAALVPGGTLLLSCNDRRIPEGAFESAVEEASRQAGRGLDDVTPLELGPDFTARGPGLRSTQGVIARVR